MTDGETLHHTSFVVNDVERTARSLAASLGVSFGVWTIEPESCVVRGEPVRLRFRLAIAPVGASNLELIQPLDDDGPYAEHLREKGEGFHHTCIAYETRDALRRARAKLESEGRPVEVSGSLGDLGEFVYFEMKEIGGFLELLYVTELPPPEMTIG